MKLNLDYYDEKLDINKTPEEFEEIYEKVMDYTGEDFSLILDTHSKIKNILALSDIRENILNWYEFKKNAIILELNSNYGEITGLLCNRAKRVVSIQESKKYSEIIEKRHKNKENLELIVGDISKINLNEKFDYIIIIGIAENLKEKLEYAKKYLKEDGVILIAVNNKFGVKAWITSNDSEKVIGNTKTAISKEQLELLLQEMNYKFYYPLPNYKMPNIIYTENTMPTLSNIYRDLTYKDENVNFKEIDSYREIIKNNPEDFKKFANSFLIEISNKKIKKNEIRFITFSNMRKDEYRIKTIVKEKEVYKTNTNDKSKNHINNIKRNIELLNKLKIKNLDTYNNETIISKYIEGKTLEDELINILKEQGKDMFIKKIIEYKEFLKEKLEIIDTPQKNIFTKYKIEISEDLIAKLTFIKHGLWDLIFQNCFIIDNEYYFYDQEWYEENVPVEYILYRAILYFNESKKYITDEEIFDKLGIIEYISIFKKIDDKIQEKIRKTLFWNIHTKDELEKNRYTKIKRELQEKEQEILSLKNEINKLNGENIQKCNELTIIKNSLSWKVTKPLRGIRKIINKK